MMQQIKSIGVFKTSVVFGVLNFVLGVVSAVIMAIAPVAPMMQDHPGMLIAMPVGYALGGFLLSAIVCTVYNAIAKFTGGIEIELSSVPDLRDCASAPRARASERS